MGVETMTTGRFDHSRGLREHALQQMRYQQAAERYAAQFSADDAERRVVVLLLTLTATGWRLLVDRDWPRRRTASADMVLVGPTGVYVIDVPSWRDQPTVLEDQLHAGTESRHNEVHQLAVASRPVEEALVAMQMSPVAVTPVLIFADHELDTHLGRVRLLGRRNAASALTTAAIRMRPAVVRAVATYLAETFPQYQAHNLDPASADTAEHSTPQLLDDGLFDADQLREAELHAARSKPMESWMTFLHPAQVPLVGRSWGGPARISGAAGTGKSVVGMHRAVYLAQRSTGKVLFTTFATNLPRVTTQLLEQMAPSVAGPDRVRQPAPVGARIAAVARRAVPVGQGPGRGLFLPGMAVGIPERPAVEADRAEPGLLERRDRLRHQGPGDQNVRRVPPGRPGRATHAAAEHASPAVWAMYEEYERLLHTRGLHDFQDVLRMALEQVRAEPVNPPYAAVIVDEVQDLPLIGIQLLHALIGDKPNGLLLIGDNQQSVYPGGFRLAEAGITITGGRAERLDVNYRNAADILDAALAVMDGEPFEDLDGTVVSDRPAVELTYFGGGVARVNVPSLEEHDRLLVEAVQKLAAQLDPSPSPLADSALLCAGRHEVNRYRTMLEKAGVPTLRLENYDGQHSDDLKIGTFRRAKGLEFKHVFLPQHDQAVRDTAQGRFSDADRHSIALRQLFVGMTRARDSLWLGSVEP
ncbi:nuclease-related domain-containing DEAD/DEAH box helicase [Dactylosporangium cerinum]